MNDVGNKAKGLALFTMDCIEALKKEGYDIIDFTISVKKNNYTFKIKPNKAGLIDVNYKPIGLKE